MKTWGCMMNMIDKNTMKPHIAYDGFSESWLCSSEDGPWDICIGAGETLLSAYHNWMWRAIGLDITIDKHWSGPCQDGGKWGLT